MPVKLSLFVLTRVTRLVVEDIEEDLKEDD